MKIGSAEVVEMKALLDNVPKADRRCHKNVVARLDSGLRHRLLVAAEISLRIISAQRFAQRLHISHVQRRA